jgi:hypothetical protein
MHSWAEPAERTLIAAHRAGQTCATPRVGEPFEPADTPPADPWWRAVSTVPAQGWAPWPPVAPVREDAAAGR